jgi:hypothetical protein
MPNKFECYEIWRPNIPDNGCTKQCKECAEKQLSKIKDLEKKIVYVEDYLAEIKQELKHANSNRKPTVRNKIITQKAVIKSLKKELKKEIENI